MKKIKFIILLLLIAINCKAQNPVINILDWNGVVVSNSYLKDVNNDMNQFEGTYLYENNGTMFKIVLRKVTMAFDGRHYEDLIIGEIEYEDGNLNYINTLSELNSNYTYQYSHRIAGFRLMVNEDIPVCNDCLPNEKRISLKINDTRVSGGMIIRKTVEGDNVVLKAFKRSLLPFVKVGEPTIGPIIPDGFYTFIKQ